MKKKSTFLNFRPGPPPPIINVKSLNEKWLKLVFLTISFYGHVDFEQDLKPLIQSPRGNCYINGPCLVSAWRSGGFMETWPLWHATVYTLVSSSCISFYDRKTEKNSKKFTSNCQYMSIIVVG